MLFYEKVLKSLFEQGTENIIQERILAYWCTTKNKLYSADF